MHAHKHTSTHTDTNTHTITKTNTYPYPNPITNTDTITHTDTTQTHPTDTTDPSTATTPRSRHRAKSPIGPSISSDRLGSEKGQIRRTKTTKEPFGVTKKTRLNIEISSAELERRDAAGERGSGGDLEDAVLGVGDRSDSARRGTISMTSVTKRLFPFGWKPSGGCFVFYVLCLL